MTPTINYQLLPARRPDPSDMSATKNRSGRIDPTGLTVRQSSIACGVSMDTVRRRLVEGVPGARREDDGSWSIPIGGLAAVGLVPRLERISGLASDHSPPSPEAADELTELRVRCAVAEALASARAEHLADLQAEVAVLRDALMTKKES